MNYKTVNINNFLDNIKTFKQKYNYQNYILNVSNNAFNLGIKIIKYLDNTIDYLYSNSFQDIINIRKYNHDIKIIYSGIINEDNIYDLILNNVILVVNNVHVINFIISLDIKEKFDIIFRVDKYSCDINTVNNILDDIKNNKYLNVLGIITNEFKDNLKDDFKLIITSDDKILANSIILNESIYNNVVKINSFISNITEDYKYGIMPLGKYDEISKKSKVLINNKYYKIKEIRDEYTIIKIDKLVNLNDKLEIKNSDNNFSNLKISYKKD